MNQEVPNKEGQQIFDDKRNVEGIKKSLEGLADSEKVIEISRHLSEATAGAVILAKKRAVERVNKIQLSNNALEDADALKLIEDIEAEEILKTREDPNTELGALIVLQNNLIKKIEANRRERVQRIERQEEKAKLLEEQEFLLQEVENYEDTVGFELKVEADKARLAEIEARLKELNQMDV
jgi:hypothetical protein